MPSLLPILTQISDWIEVNKPVAFSCMLPGVDETVINNINTYLPAQLPRNVVELYRWGNGYDERLARKNLLFSELMMSQEEVPFVYWHQLQIDDAVSIYQAYLELSFDESDLQYYENVVALNYQMIFPLFMSKMNDYYLGVILGDMEDKNPIVIYHSIEPEFPENYSPSLYELIVNSYRSYDIID